jgi:small conductance mechanosensitive channel
MVQSLISRLIATAEETAANAAVESSGTSAQGIMEKIQELFVVYGFKLLAAIAIYIIGKMVVKVLCAIVEKMMVKANVDVTLAKFTRHILYFGLMICVIIAALQMLGVPTAQFVVVLGAAGLAIGFALQGSLSNFASGILIMVFKPFKAGDYVEIANQGGTVVEVQLFNTVINTPDNVRVVVPNGGITTNNIKNYTANGQRRVDMVFGISYGDDIQKARDIITEVINSDERVLKSPAPMIAVSELADSSVNIVARPWATVADYWGLYFDMQEKIKNALEAGGCTIPFPQHDVHVIQEK